MSLPLVVPFVRHRPCQLLQLHRFRLPSLQNRLDNVRASSVNRIMRSTKLRVTFSACAISPADRHLLLSSNRFQRSPLAGFLGSAAGCSPPDYSQAGRSHPQQSSRSTSVAQ